jgi:protein SCO1/2
MTSDLRPGANSRSKIGGPFVLTGSDGTVVTDRTLRGHWLLVYFGYTYCPDICRTTLLAVSQAMQKLGPLAANVRPIFVSIDAERDTPQRVDQFTKSLDPRIVGLTGRPAEIAALAKQYRVFFQKKPVEGSDEYFMEHSSYVWVMDPGGRYVTLFTGDEAQEPDTIARRLRELLTAASRGDNSVARHVDTKAAASPATLKPATQGQ